MDYVLIVDFGSQVTQLIARRVRESGVYCEIVPFNKAEAAFAAQPPKAVILSGGPNSVTDADTPRAPQTILDSGLPILGICLGHQCIGEYFGGQVVRADRLMHGKTSPMEHDGEDLFSGMPTPFKATRYHSLLLDPASLPAALKITAQTHEGEIMGIKHKELPIWGVQFHPESLATENGIMILKNFLKLC